MPMASIAKLVCALVSLELRPLASTEGETYQLGPKDTKYYRDFLAQDGSVAPVSEEIPLTRRQMLELMLLPSSNNHTLSYVDWMFGSNEAYVKAAQSYLSKHDLTEITVVESTGFDLGNVASARALVKIGALALADPVLSEIMAKKSVIIPGAGEVFSTNPLLGDPGVRGMKTGTTTAEKKNLLLAQDLTASGRTLTAIIVTLGLPSDEQRVIATRKLAQFVTQLKEPFDVAKKGEVVAQSTSWDGQPINLVAALDETVVLTLGESVERTLQLDPLIPGSGANSHVGFIVLDGPTGIRRIPVVVRESVPEPDALWRITHPIEVLGWLTARLS
jgi:D-alanyl-D-alanine carboxypeptidase (penicillin-binding protein 5/6)